MRLGNTLLLVVGHQSQCRVCITKSFDRHRHAHFLIYFHPSSIDLRRAKYSVTFSVLGSCTLYLLSYLAETPN